MNWRSRTLIAAALCLVMAAPVRAGSWFFQVHGGFGTFNMDDVNDSIDSFNDELGTKNLNTISSGPEAGFQVGKDLTPELELGLGVTRLWASSRYSGDGYLVELDLPADLYEVSLNYRSVTSRKVRVGAGATLGMINTGASIQVNQPGFPDRKESYDGLGFHFSAYGMAESALSPTWSVCGQGGFRHALLNHLKVDGETVYNPDSVDDKLRFNYTGLFLRVGVKFRP